MDRAVHAVGKRNVRFGANLGAEHRDRSQQESRKPNALQHRSASSSTFGLVGGIESMIHFRQAAHIARRGVTHGQRRDRLSALSRHIAQQPDRVLSQKSIRVRFRPCVARDCGVHYGPPTATAAAPLQFLILLVASWIGSRQGEAVEYLRAENRVLRARLGPKPLRFVDAERRLLAQKGRPATVGGQQRPLRRTGGRNLFPPRDAVNPAISADYVELRIIRGSVCPSTPFRPTV